MAADWNPRANQIFLRASEIDGEDERRAFVDAECRGDGELHAAVAALLAARDRMGSFLESDATSPPDGASETSAYRPIAEGPGSVIGPYKLLQQIGEGGFGAVYMAEQEKPIRRMVAVKIIKPGMDSGEVIARFESERQALAMMDHPNIAKVLDAGATETGRPYFVMELVKGIPITEFCDRNKMPADQRLKLFADVCHAIQHAHHKGVIHRDIKPSNVLVTLHDGVPVVKVIDFGIAKATLQKLTERTLFTAYGAMIGTPAYMSPEQAELSGLDIDTRSDIYSLGVLLYELLTGTTPLESRRLREAGYAEIQRLVREEESPRPSYRLSSLGQAATAIAGNRGTDAKVLSRLLSGDLDWIVMKALEKDRSRRYGTPDAFAEDIDRYFRSESVLARPPSPGYRLRKFARRNRGVMLTASAVAAALLIGLTIATWQAVRARRAEKAALDREAETAAVLGFVQQRVFAAARPKGQHGGLGYDVKLADAIQSAVPYIEKNFESQPLIEARVRTSLGQSFRDLGNAPMAIEQFQRARFLLTEHLGPVEPDTLECTNRLADSYNAVGRHAEALKLYEETIAQAKATLGPDHLVTLNCMNNVANSYEGVGRVADALRIREEVLTLRKNKHEPGHPATLTAMNNLAASYEASGRLGEALKLREETLVLRKARLGLDHPDTLSAMGGLANTYEELGRLPEALKLREETLLLERASLGPDHPETLSAMSNLALSYEAAGRQVEAAKLYQECLSRMKATLGADHPHTLNTMSNLTPCLDSLGRHGESMKLREETCVLAKARFGPEHPITLNSMNTLAWALATVGDETLRNPARALELARETTRLASGPNQVVYRATLGTARYRCGDWKGAILDLEPLIRSRPPEDPASAIEAFFLAMAHWQLGEKDQARAWYGKAVAWMAKNTRDDPELKRFRAEAEALMQIKPAS